MAFKMSGFSAFTKNGNSSDHGDPDVIYQEITDNKKEIRRFKDLIKEDPEKYRELANRGVNPLARLNEAMNDNIEQWEKLTGKKYGQGIFE